MKMDNEVTPPRLEINKGDNHPEESTPPAPNTFPSSFRRPNMPISPSDQVMSPVSKLFNKSKGEGLRMVMNRKSAPKPILSSNQGKRDGEDNGENKPFHAKFINEKSTWKRESVFYSIRSGLKGGA
jgi:hypothetical protein